MPTDYIDLLDTSLERIVLPDWTCNDANTTEFDFSKFRNLKTLIIGNDSFYSVKTFRIKELDNLTTIQIGKNSFTQKKLGYGNNSDKSFCIENCKSLTTISIGEFSFTDFGNFTLQNLEKLTSISIGSLGKNSLNFYSCSLRIESTAHLHASMFA